MMNVSQTQQKKIKTLPKSTEPILICNNILTACAIPSYQNSSTIVWRGYSFTLRFIITLLPVVTSTAFSALPIISA